MPCFEFLIIITADESEDYRIGLVAFNFSARFNLFNKQLLGSVQLKSNLASNIQGVILEFYVYLFVTSC